MRWTFDRWLTACGAELASQFNWTLEHAGLRGFDWRAAYGRGLTVRAACDAAYDHVQETALDGALYFNCCTGNAAPDWSQFDSLETGGCTTEKDPETGFEWTNGGEPDNVAEFWTVYGRLKEGGCEAITDCKTRADVDAVALRLSELSGLPVH